MSGRGRGGQGMGVPRTPRFDLGDYGAGAPTVEKDGAVIFAKSSYTGKPGSLGHPTFVEGSGDLDECNGIMTKDGYRYVMTCELDGDELVPTYPYTIPVFKGQPEHLNYPERMRTKNGVKNFIKQNAEVKGCTPEKGCPFM